MAQARKPRKPWAAFAVIGVLLAGYLVSLIVRVDIQGDDVATWMVVGIELGAAGLCIARALGPRRGRAIPLVLGAALFAWAIGDLILTLEAAAGGAGTSPSFADISYLAFYPLMYVALVLLMRREVHELGAATWLDGLIAGLGAAAVLACFAFATILQDAGGDAAAVAVNLAYPIGDVLLLLIVAGGSAIVPGRPSPQWLLLAGACALNAAGDTFNLVEASRPATHLGDIVNGIAWPVAITAMSLSGWLRPPRATHRVQARATGFLLPGLGAGAGLAVLFTGTLRPLQPVALGLATATLVTVGIRLVLSTRRLRSVTEKRQRQALTDELTGLGNRRQLFSLLDSFFSDQADTRTPPRHLAFLFVDLDHFKEINDSFGHAAGDELLRQLGPRLEASLRSSDVLVRVGGDELGVVVMDSDAAYATSVAERITETLREPFVLEGVSVRISASIGIASGPADASDSAGLVRCADLAMYRAKTASLPFAVYVRDVDDAGNRLRLVDELRVAVDTGAFAMHYQPQIDLRTGDIAGVEALVRWTHPRIGLVPPLDFLPLAEEAGLMPRVTATVLDQTLWQCAEWREEGQDLTVSVNVSVSDLLDPGFVDLVTGTLGRHRLPPTSLIIEITETTIIRDFDVCRLIIGRLRALGVGVSVDDFGAGFTSLAYLGSLAVSELKLDRTFLLGLAGDEPGRDEALVQATINLGHALGMRVVAEGIEDAATLATLTAMGCDLGQGFFISRPMPAAELVLHPGGRILELPRLASN